MSCTCTYATLRIFSPELSSLGISKAIGLSSTDARDKDPNSKYAHVREWSYWNLSTKGMSTSLETIDHVRAIAEVLSGKEELLQSLRATGCKMDIFCLWEFSGQGCVGIDVDCMKRLVDLGLDITWDVYADETQ